MKVFVVGSSIGYSRFIKDRTLVNDINEAEVVLFTGGEDINPAIYGCQRHPSTYFNERRDKFEIDMFKLIKPNQLAVGICRGAQLFCGLLGGLLVQDCKNHALCGTHGICDWNKEKVFEISSMHHQMQYPFTMNKRSYDILYNSQNLRSPSYYGEKIKPEIIKERGEPEIVYYHKIGYPRCLGIQGHPECMPHSPVSTMINELIIDLIQ